MKNKILIAIGILLVITLGVSFAYFVSGIAIGGSGSNASGTTAELLKVSYDAGTSILSGTGLIPGTNTSKTFTVIVTPGSDTNEATYAIKLNISNNTFVKCDDSNYNSMSNACTKNAQELVYTIKDSSGNVIKTGDLTGKSGEVVLATETKTVSAATEYTYTLEIEFKETNADQNHNMNKSITGNVKVEFAEKPKNLSDTIIAYNHSTRTSFSSVVTAASTNTVYTAEDDDGTSYYFVGAPTDNYVKFAGKYWRIIRINGDRTIRLIYAGETSIIDGLANKADVLANGYDDSSTDYTQTGTSAFNSSNDDNMYVGYMYTRGQVHGLGTSSAIKGVLDIWYTQNLASYANYIDTNAGFCGDRTTYTNYTGTTTGGGTGTTETYYRDYVRYWGASNGTPTLKCVNSSDLYTTSNSNKGNKALTNPIGLINMNEVWSAGGYQAVNKNYYLYTGNLYWTMSPGAFDGYATTMFDVDSVGRLDGYSVEVTYGVRPVINLKANTLINSGTGTALDPFVIGN